ncbi:MAG: amino acid ABC transporter permease, partial [Nitrospinota bacterium]
AVASSTHLLPISTGVFASSAGGVSVSAGGGSPGPGAGAAPPRGGGGGRAPPAPPEPLGMPSFGLQYEFRWSVLWEDPFGYWILQGIKNTLILSSLAWVIALALGITLGILRTTPWRLPRLLAGAYVEFFRNTPLLVQLFFWYFAVPQVLPEGPLRQGLNQLEVETPFLTINYEFLAPLVGLGIYTAARVAETVRSGILSIPKQQSEAALSSGLSWLQAYRYVLLPIGMRIVIPPMTTEFLTIFKNSSLATTIGFAEITFMTQQVDSYTFRGLEAVTAGTLLYLAISLTIAASMSRVERRYTIPGFVGRGAGGG